MTDTETFASPWDDDRLSAYVDGELPSDERELFERLLTERHDYRKAVEDLRSLRARFQAWVPPTLKHDLTKPVQTAVAKRDLLASAGLLADESPCLPSEDSSTPGSGVRARLIWLAGTASLAAAIALLMWNPWGDARRAKEVVTPRRHADSARLPSANEKPDAEIAAVVASDASPASEPTAPAPLMSSPMTAREARPVPTEGGESDGLRAFENDVSPDQPVTRDQIVYLEPTSLENEMALRAILERGSPANLAKKSRGDRPGLGELVESRDEESALGGRDDLIEVYVAHDLASETLRQIEQLVPNVAKSEISLEPKDAEIATEFGKLLEAVPGEDQVQFVGVYSADELPIAWRSVPEPRALDSIADLSADERARSGSHFAVEQRVDVPQDALEEPTAEANRQDRKPPPRKLVILLRRFQE